MFECGKHGQQAITSTENFMDSTVHTLACKCRGTLAQLREGWPAVPEPGPLTTEDLQAFVSRLPGHQLAELRSMLPPDPLADLAYLDTILVPSPPQPEPEPEPVGPPPTLEENLTEALAEPKKKKAAAK